MAYSLTLPARNKAQRARMALDDGEPDFTVPKLIAWCGTNMSRQEILDLVDSLSGLAAKLDAEDDEPAGTPDIEAFNRERAQKSEEALARKLSGMDSRHRAARPSANAVKSFNDLYPESSRIKQAL